MSADGVEPPPERAAVERDPTADGGRRTWPLTPTSPDERAPDEPEGEGAVPPYRRPFPLTRYYRLDSSRYTLRELRHVMPSFRAFLRAALGRGLLRSRYGTRLVILRVDQIDPVAEGAVPGPLRPGLAQKTAAYQAEGWRRLFVYRWPLLGPLEAYGAAFLAADGRAAGVAAGSVGLDPRKTPAPHWACAIASRLTDGRCWKTCDYPPKLVNPPEDEIAYLPGQPVAVLVRRHYQRLAGVGDLVERLAEEDVGPFLVADNNREVDFQASRGVYVPLPEQDVRRMNDV